MRILIVSDVSSRMRGGVPTETRLLIRGLCARGHAVAFASDSPISGAEEAAHYRIALPFGNSTVADVAATIHEFRPDFVHLICMSSGGVAKLAPILRAHRWALTVHSVPPHERKLGHLHEHEALHYGARALRFLANNLAWRWILRSGMVPTVIVHSRYVEAIVNGYGSKRIASIPLPFEIASSAAPMIESQPDRGFPLLVTVAGLAHTKGQHDVLKALPLLLPSFPFLHFQAIGEIRDSSYLRYLKALAKQLQIEAHVEIKPDLADAEKAAVLARADVYVQPSHEEGFCLAYAEAAATVPRLVGTDTGAIASISSHDRGARVVPVRQPEALARAISEVLRCELPCDHMEQRILRLSERFSISNYLSAHESLYANAI